MKILLVSDIHEDYVAAENAWRVEEPDFVLDCGDHEQIKNLFELTPHLYIHGNHEPSEVEGSTEGYPLPFKIPEGVVVVLKKDNLELRVAGIDGNYANKDKPNSITDTDIDSLRRLPQGGVDLLLTHESPLLVPLGSKYMELAGRVISEIDRIQPKFVISGHYGKFNASMETPRGVRNLILDDIRRGYCILNGETYNFSRKIVRFR